MNALTAARVLRSVLCPQIAVRQLIRRFHLGPTDFRLAMQAVDRPQYAYGVKQAVQLAVKLGLRSVSVIEFGVAGGDGLVLLDQYAAVYGKMFGMKVEVYGFDLGSGLPTPYDYRDLPYVWQGGFYKMDVDRVKERLQTARLFLGDVRVTVPEFLASDPAPIGFISFDLDFYSSTVDALRIFRAGDSYLLPRILCYFDDVTSNGHQLHCDQVGELCAIQDFNSNSRDQVIAPLRVMDSEILFPATWLQQLYVYHRFAHDAYNTYIGSVPARSVLSDSPAR